MRYRVTVEVERVERRPDSRSSLPRFFTRKFWESDFAVEGDASVVAAALRVAVDKLERNVPCEE